MSESSNSRVLSRALLLPLRRISLISSSSDVGSFAMIPAREQPGQAARWEKARWECSGCSPVASGGGAKARWHVVPGGHWGGGRRPHLTVGVGLVELVVLLLGSSLHPQGRPLRREEPHTAMSPLLARGHLHFRSVPASSPVPREWTAAESALVLEGNLEPSPRAHPSQMTWTESHVPGGHELGTRAGLSCSGLASHSLLGP